MFDQTSFSPTERQVILLAISAENHCTYCVAAHSMIAKQMTKADPGIVEALRYGKPQRDSQLDVLAGFSQAVVKNRGVVCGQTLDKFIKAGYSRAQVLEVLLGMAFKTLSSYTNQFTHVPLGTVFQAEAWEEPRSMRQPAVCLNA
ncbi:carboxymuconolactone decarboxylase family protein [Methylomonas rosea]|uniref:Carboxymuconolactone decarboxylase family protein n=1 Tax=Methylomonas rosea TaxID=2952227 RepID=A0ABT1TTA2_9GAMM|nr:carboxymuconolactone decarboxylase family protein [Methylomonas sp. WSC-7]MCQ8118015.1 carboxymuconolactone decarboxylase family protein [Methylomonas sp. WSC-7]